MHRRGGDADGQRDLEVQAGDPGPGGGGLTEPSGGALGGRQRQARQQDGELAALHPGDHGLRRRVLPQQAGGDQQQLVAGRVAEGVGDVRVAVQRREHEAGPRGGRLDQQQGVDLGGQALPVGQPGQPVVVGVVPDLAQQLLLADRGVHVGEHRVQRTRSPEAKVTTSLRRSQTSR